MSYLLINDERFHNVGFQRINRGFIFVSSRPINEISISLDGQIGNFNNINQSGKLDEAFALLEYGLTAFPDDINTLYYLARFYDTVKKQPEKAKPLYDKLTTAKPNILRERQFVTAADKSLRR